MSAPKHPQLIQPGSWVIYETSAGAEVRWYVGPLPDADNCVVFTERKGVQAVPAGTVRPVSKAFKEAVEALTGRGLNVGPGHARILEVMDDMGLLDGLFRSYVGPNSSGNTGD